MSVVLYNQNINQKRLRGPQCHAGVVSVDIPPVHLAMKVTEVIPFAI